MNFTDAQITRYAQEAETTLASDTKCIQNRVSLALSAGVSEYQVPDTVISISKITWRGYKLEPYTGQEMRNSGSTPGSPTQGQPRFYIYSDLGFKTIKLFPSPGIDIPLQTGDLWSMAKIRDGFIIQFASIPDFTSQQIRVPSIIRRQYIKDYVAYRCFIRAGKAMDLKAAEYFKAKFEASRKQAKVVWSLLFTCVERVNSPIQFNPGKPTRPVLPSNFGYIEE